MKALFRSPTFIVSLGQLFQMVVGIFTSTMIARHLNADGYGISNLLRTYVTYVVAITPLGLDAALLKFGSHYSNPLEFLAVTSRLRRIAASISGLVFLLVVVAGAGGLIRHFYPYPNIELLFAISFAALPFATDTVILGAVYRVRSEISGYFLRGIYAQSFFRLIIVPFAVTFWPSVTLVVVIFAVQLALSGFLLILHQSTLWQKAGYNPGVTAPNPQPGAARHVLRESLWMCASIGIFGLMRSLDIMFIGAYDTARNLGIYSALSMVSQLISIFPSALGQSLGPNVASAFHRKDLPGMHAVLQNYLDKACIVSGYVFAGVALFATRLDLVFGPSFVISPMLGLLLPLGYLISATIGPMGYSLSMTGYHREENIIMWAGAASLFAICLFAVPTYGALGAATAVLASFLLINSVRNYLIYRIYHMTFGTWKNLLPIVTALVLSQASLWAGDALGPRGLATTFFSGCIYTLTFAIVSYLFFLPDDAKKIVDGLLGQLNSGKAK